MTVFLVKKLPYDLTSHAGLSLIGHYLKRTRFKARVDALFPMRSGISNGDVLNSYIGLLCLGKSDFDAIEGFRGDAFFKRALNLSAIPSSPTLRQRLDARANEWFDLAADLNHTLLSGRVHGAPIDFGVLPCGYTPLDLDTFAMDNSGTQKECVGRTYAGIDGYCPAVIYLGTSGYCLELALRPGVQHSVAETHYNLERALPMAALLVPTPLLLRADSGFCSTQLLGHIADLAATTGREVAALIKWNPRRTPVERIARQKTADPSVRWRTLREGKRSCVWQEDLSLEGVGTPSNPVRRIYRLTERTLDKNDQPLLLPEYVLEGWTTTLPAHFAPDEIIALYRDHATHEQFHSEFKTDMDLERLPSGKFDTNHLICQLAAVAMNLLRLIGQHTLHDTDSPMRHAAKRRRIKTVMQEMMFKAARMVRHAGRWVLGLGSNDASFGVFARHYGHYSSA